MLSVSFAGQRFHFLHSPPSRSILLVAELPGSVPCLHQQRLADDPPGRLVRQAMLDTARHQFVDKLIQLDEQIISHAGAQLDEEVVFSLLPLTLGHPGCAHLLCTPVHHFSRLSVLCTTDSAHSYTALYTTSSWHD